MGFFLTVMADPFMEAIVAVNLVALFAAFDEIGGKGVIAIRAGYSACVTQRIRGA